MDAGKSWHSAVASVNLKFRRCSCRRLWRQNFRRSRFLPLRDSGNYNTRQALGPSLAAGNDVFQLDTANVIGGLVFGSIGFVAFIYGKRMNLWKIMLCGLGLMIFPYFVSDDVMIFLIGAVGTAALFFLRA
jgi:hypothetical protein